MVLISMVINAHAQVFQYFLVSNNDQTAHILDTVKLPTCTHIDLKQGVTLRNGIKAGKFTRQGMVRDMQTCIDACCQDPKCNVAFMPGHVCYTVECASDTSCEAVPATASSAVNGSVKISHIVRGGGQGDDIENFKKTQGISKYAPAPKKNCVPSRIAYNHTLKGGKTAGEYKKLGPSGSIHQCIDQCCNEDTCDVAFFLHNQCYGVQCYTDELCQKVTVDGQFTKDFTPTIAYMNSREGVRQRNKDSSCPKCVNGLCTNSDSCLCDRGYEGPDCNKTATIGKCGFPGCGKYGRCSINDTCHCAIGHHGYLCNETYSCDPPCSHGICEANGTLSTKCRCYVGWEGRNCNASNGDLMVSSQTGEEVLFTNMDQEAEMDIKIHDMPNSRSAESISALAVAIGCGIAAAIVGTAAVAFITRRILDNPSEGWRAIR